jgi:FkbM family methyltransferase
MDLRLPLYWFRQRFRTARVPPRPVLDLIDFGSGRVIVLDVGANVGGFAGDILLRAPLAEVHCFEPNTSAYADLESNATRYNVLKGRLRCFTLPAAVGSRVETRDLIVTGFEEASSLLAVTDHCRRGWPSVDFSNKRRESVRVIRLDDYLNRHGLKTIKLLKIDVQGFELEVLRGLGDRLTDVEYIVAEVQFQALYDGAPPWDAIIQYAAPYGFTPLLLDGLCLAPDGRPLQADVLLRRRTQQKNGTKA